jgi:hypothetical protein
MRQKQDSREAVEKMVRLFLAASRYQSLLLEVVTMKTLSVVARNQVYRRSRRKCPSKAVFFVQCPIQKSGFDGARCKIRSIQTLQ